MRHLTAEQQAATQERREQFRKLVKVVADMPEDKRAELAAKIPVTTCEGHTLSGFNQCLVAMQYPTATLVGGFRQWLQHGRAVQKGQHGICIWIPKEKKAKDDEPKADKPDLAFFMGTIFDISQTMEVEVPVS